MIRLGIGHRLASAAVVGCLALAPPAAPAAAPASERPHVVAIRLDGTVSPLMDEALTEALDRAVETHADAVLLEVDTPGGLESSMRTMVKRILASERPVIAWVTPGGGHAASAGVFIVMAADVAAMAPGTNIGAATPINLQGPMDSTLARKVTNDASAFARTIAAQRSRNAAWAERAVREAVSASETEAVTLRIVDFIARTESDVLARADGRTWRRGAETHVLRTRGADVDRIEPGFRRRLLAVLGDPNVAYLLMLLGFYGLMFELQNPGAVLPGVVGAICLLLAFLAFSTLPVQAAGIALILLGLGFLLLEVKLPTHGVLGVGGAIALFLGSLILFQGDTMRLSLAVITVATLVTVVFFLFVVGAGLRAQRRPVATGASGLAGRHAVAVERLAPSGHVRIGDELWMATSAVDVELGTDVRVVGVEGLTLRVRPALPEG